jgi:retron-type reverse transcriptase
MLSYLSKIWDKMDWLFDGQHGFRPEYSCESQAITVFQDMADSLDNGGRIDAIIIDFAKAFDLVPHDRLLTKIAAAGLNSRVVVWLREFILGCAQRVRVGGQLSEEVRVTSGVPQGSVLSPLLFLTYVNDIWRNTKSTIRLFTDDCIIYRKIINNKNMEKLQIDLNRLGEWAVENVIVINPAKCKAVCFMRA